VIREAADDLYAPPGLDKEPARACRSLLVYPVIAGLLGIALVTFVIWILIDRDRFGGEPMAAAKTDMSAPGHAAKLSPSEPDAAAPESTGAISPAEEIAQLKALECAKQETLNQAAAGAPRGLDVISEGTATASRSPSRAASRPVPSRPSRRGCRPPASARARYSVPSPRAAGLALSGSPISRSAAS
jgi:hypothetical protein